MSQQTPAETCAARVRAIRDSLFGPLNPRRWAGVEESSRVLLGQRDEWERCRNSTYQAMIGLATADHTLAPFALGRLAQEKPHRQVMWKCLEAANLTLMNPERFPSHQDVLRRIEPAKDNPFGLVLRSLECLALA